MLNNWLQKTLSFFSSLSVLFPSYFQSEKKPLRGEIYHVKDGNFQTEIVIISNDHDNEFSGEVIGISLTNNDHYQHLTGIEINQKFFEAEDKNRYVFPFIRTFKKSNLLERTGCLDIETMDMIEEFSFSLMRLNDDLPLKDEDIQRGEVYLAGLPGISKHPVVILSEQGDYVVVAKLTSNKNRRKYPTNVRVKGRQIGYWKDSYIMTTSLFTLNKKFLQSKITKTLRKLGFIDQETMEKVNHALEISIGVRDYPTRDRARKQGFILQPYLA